MTRIFQAIGYVIFMFVVLGIFFNMIYAIDEAGWQAAAIEGCAKHPEAKVCQ